MLRKNVKYVYGRQLCEIADKNSAVKGRARLTHNLIKSYGLFNRLQLLAAKCCKAGDLRGFHTRDYVDQLQATITNSASKHIVEECDEHDADSSVLEEFGLGFDCPTWPGLDEYTYAIAGATMTACEALCAATTTAAADEPLVVINWTGGWHHAERSKAAGFCYVNDIVLGILVLRKRFQRVLYVDLDVHHGDGVEGAFETTKRVLTLSFHQHECGFYPGTGAVTDCGMAHGKGYAVNFAYRSGISGTKFRTYFKRITNAVLERYQPDVCVLQCGADAIVGDPLGGTNLTTNDLISCIELLVARKLPTLLLGGGGYNFANAARYWTQVTAALCGVRLAEDIPDACESFLDFGPDYSLHIPVEKHRKDMNTDAYLEQCAHTIEAQLERFNVTAI